MKKEYKNSDKCVQCGREFEGACDIESKIIGVCTYHDCANYGLLAFGINALSKFKVDVDNG